ncbi:MAG TPA: hypothetical protein VK158_05385 [Acidobacteriota bacterium]|nr:hypothetical protein [Acidobacteriota bacterium]
MPEDEYVVTNAKEFSYNGVFSFKDFYDLLGSFLKERGYDKYEKRHEVKEFADGKTYEFLVLPEKKVTDSEAFTLEIVIVGKGLKPIEVPIDGKKKTIDQGSLYFYIRAVMYTNKDSRWEDKKNPEKFTIWRWVADNIVFRGEREKLVQQAKKDIDELYDILTNYLNMHSSKRY